MKKEKKIGFNYSPYKTAKDKKVDKDGNRLYQLIMGLTYNRKATRFPLNNADLPDIYFLKKDIEDGSHYSNYTQILEQQVEGIIRFEDKVVGDKYSIKGIKDRLFYYRKGLSNVLDNCMIRDLKRILGDYYTYNEFKDLISPLAIGNETTSSKFLFLFEYNFFNNKSFQIKDKLPEKFIDSIVAYFWFLLYEVHFENNVENNKRLVLLNFIYPTFKNEFQTFVEAGIPEKLVKEIKVQDEIFAKVYKQYKKEIMNANFEEVWLALSHQTVTSNSFLQIKHKLDFMKLA